MAQFKIEQIRDFNITLPVNGEIFQYNGTNWVNVTFSSGDGNGIFDASNNGATVSSTYVVNLTDTLSFAGSLIIINNGQVIINEDGLSTADVRIEGDTDTNLFFTDASTEHLFAFPE